MPGGCYEAANYEAAAVIWRKLGPIPGFAANLWIELFLKRRQEICQYNLNRAATLVRIVNQCFIKITLKENTSDSRADLPQRRVINVDEPEVSVKSLTKKRDMVDH